MSQNTIEMNDPCPCGSGSPYRDCCGRALAVKRRQRRNLALVGIVAVGGVVASWAYMNRIDEAKRASLTLPEGSYFHKEHRHWHDQNDVEIKLPGKVWAMNEQRWVNITDILREKALARKALEDSLNPEANAVPIAERFPNLPDPESGVPEPAGEAPEGQVWSERHGHYHLPEFE